METAEADGALRYVVLGASGGIGSATARSLAASGARLVLAGRSRERLSPLAEELNAEVRTLDATRIEDVQAGLDEAAERLGGLDGVVNCVGSLLLKPAHLTRPGA